MRSNLPSISFELVGGLNTKYSPETVAGKHLIEAVNVDAYGRFLSLGKVPGSSKINASATDSIQSMHYYEATAFDRTFDRNLLIATDDGASGFDLRGVDLSTGVVSDLFTLDAAEPMTSASLLNRLFLSSTNQGGANTPTGGVKYDGARVSRWGVSSPGTDNASTIEDCDATTDFSIVTRGAGSSGVLSVDTDAKIEGTGSVNVAVTDIAGVTSGSFPGRFTLTYNPAATFDIDPNSSEAWRFWFFIPSGALPLLDNAHADGTTPEEDGSIIVEVNDGSIQRLRPFRKEDLIIGWNLLSCNLEGEDWDTGVLNSGAIDKIDIDVYMQGSVPDFRIDYIHSQERGRLTPTATLPDVTITAPGVYTSDTPYIVGPVDDSTSTYTYRTTYFTENGLESNAGPISEPVSVRRTKQIQIYEVDGDGGTGTDPADTNTFLVGDVDGAGGRTYTWKTVTGTADDVAIVAGQRETMSLAMAAAINGDDSNPQVHTGTVAAPLVIAYGQTADLPVSGTDPEIEDFLTTVNGSYILNTGQFVVVADNPGTDAAWDSYTSVIFGGTPGWVRAINGAANSSFIPAAGLQYASDGQFVRLSDIPISSDDQVVARYIYRDKDSAGIWQFLVEIEDNHVDTTGESGTTYNDPPFYGHFYYNDDFVEQGSLSASTPPLAATVNDNSPPGVPFAHVVAAENRIFGVSGHDSTTILISEISNPEVFPLLAQLSAPQPVNSIAWHTQGIVFYAGDSTYLLVGDGVNVPFGLQLVNAQLGANNIRSVVEVLQAHHVVQHEKHIYLVDDVRRSWLLSDPIQDQLDADLSATDLESMFLVHDRARSRVVAFEPSGGRIWVYQYGVAGFKQVTGDSAGNAAYSGTPVQDLRVGSWFELTVPSTVTPTAAVQGERESDIPELWVGTDEGFIYVFQDPAEDDWARESGTEPVDADFTTAHVPLGAENDARGEPRYLKLNMENSEVGDTTWACTIELFTDAAAASLGSVTFNITVPAGETSPLVSVPPIGARGEWATVRLRNNTTGESGLIRSARLYYIPRGFRGTRTS